MTITYDQLRTAHRLATAHGHQWGGRKTDEIIDAGLDAAMRFAAGDRHGDDLARYIAGMRDTGLLPVHPDVLARIHETAAADLGPCGGICGPTIVPGYEGHDTIVHTTGSGRLSWTVDDESGVTLTVSRPTGTCYAEALRVVSLDVTRDALLDGLSASRGASIALATVKVRRRVDEVEAGPSLTFGRYSERTSSIDVRPFFRDDHVAAMATAVIAACDGVGEAVEDIEAAVAIGDPDFRYALLTFLRARRADLYACRGLGAMLGVPRWVHGSPAAPESDPPCQFNVYICVPDRVDVRIDDEAAGIGTHLRVTTAVAQDIYSAALAVVQASADGEHEDGGAALTRSLLFACPTAEVVWTGPLCGESTDVAA